MEIEDYYPKVTQDRQEHMGSISFPAIDHHKEARRNGYDPEKVATTIELLDRPQLLPILLHFISVLGHDWTFRVYHSLDNAEIFKAPALRRHLLTRKLVLVPMNITFANHEQVSEFYAYPNLWHDLAPAKYVLLFQFDSILCARSSKRLEDYFEYDFIGGPVSDFVAKNPNIAAWGNAGPAKNKVDTKSTTFMMNGGISLRNRAAMLKVIDQFGPFRDPTKNNSRYEDQFFVTRLREMGANMPSFDAAKQFSVETVYDPEPFALHQPGRFLKHLHPEGLLHLEQQWCPEVALLPKSAWFKNE